MPRDCSHMPGAAKNVECPLCRDLEKHGKVVTKNASEVLNQQPVPPKVRTCPRCKGDTRNLVTREGELMCAPCAESLDE